MEMSIVGFGLLWQQRHIDLYGFTLKLGGVPFPLMVKLGKSFLVFCVWSSICIYAGFVEEAHYMLCFELV